MKAVLDIIEYLRDHPKGMSKVFPRWSEAALAIEINKAIGEKRFVWDEVDGKICGVCLAMPNHEEKILRILGIVCDRKDTLAGFIKKFYEFYPDYTLTAKRHGKEVTYFNSTKLLKKLLCK